MIHLIDAFTQVRIPQGSEKAAAGVLNQFSTSLAGYVLRSCGQRDERRLRRR